MNSLTSGYGRKKNPFTVSEVLYSIYLLTEEFCLANWVRKQQSLKWLFLILKILKNIWGGLCCFLNCQFMDLFQLYLSFFEYLESNMEKSGLWNNAWSSWYLCLLFCCEDLGWQEGTLSAFDWMEGQFRWVKVLGPAGNVKIFFVNFFLKETKHLDELIYRMLRKEISVFEDCILKFDYRYSC